MPRAERAGHFLLSILVAIESHRTAILRHQTIALSTRGGVKSIRRTLDVPAWVESAHSIDDDVSTSEQVMFIELAGILHDWPVRNQVVEKALHEAARHLLAMAQDNPG